MEDFSINSQQYDLFRHLIILNILILLSLSEFIYLQKKPTLNHNQFCRGKKRKPPAPLRVWGWWSHVLLLMEEILHQLLGILSHDLQGFFYIPGGAGFLPSTVGHSLNGLQTSCCILNYVCLPIGSMGQTVYLLTSLPSAIHGAYGLSLQVSTWLYLLSVPGCHHSGWLLTCCNIGNFKGNLVECHLKSFILLLIEEILHHLGCIKPCTVNIGLFTISTGAGFLPSTVGHVSRLSDTPFIIAIYNVFFVCGIDSMERSKPAVHSRGSLLILKVRGFRVSINLDNVLFATDLRASGKDMSCNWWQLRHSQWMTFI